ncbi:MAG: ATP-binding cassette domain-containing protein [Gammaproteobacteria bacterium]
MTAKPCIIEIDGLWTQYGDTVVLEDVNLCVHYGEVLALIGGSGSGKTTLLRNILGLETPSRGTVKVFGVSLHEGDPQARADLRNRWGVLFQGGALYSALTVFDNIALPLRELRLLDEAAIRTLVKLKLDMVQIELKDAGKMPAELSGGMVKRVALARALVLEPELLVLDEPTAGLDPELSESFAKLIGNLRKELSFTVVMVTHDLDTLSALSDRVAVLAKRRLIAVDTLKNVMEFDHPFVHKFFAGRFPVGLPENIRR